MSLLYRNSVTRTTLIIRGQGKVIDDQDGRRRIFDMAPEVEQRHDTAMTGAAVVIDASTINGTSPMGPVMVVIK
ncbi:MAG: hypothetical protein ACLQDV_26275 [Candidatus Binataceae bacterium]